jgi:hypothetical protein
MITLLYCVCKGELLGSMMTHGVDSYILKAAGSCCCTTCTVEYATTSIMHDGAGTLTRRWAPRPGMYCAPTTIDRSIDDSFTKHKSIDGSPGTICWKTKERRDHIRVSEIQSTINLPVHLTYLQSQAYYLECDTTHTVSKLNQVLSPF